MEELISVVLNVYNGEKYFRKCLESVLNQTYKNLEVLIINDGSTDNTLDICKSYKDKRIRIIDQKNMGLSKSRNVGIEKAKGEYLYFVDSDDFIDDDTVEYLYKLIKEHDAQISICIPKAVYSYDFEIKEPKEKITNPTSKEMIRKILVSEENAGAFWNKLYRKDIFKTIRFEDRIINDVVVMYKIYLEAEKIVQSNQIKYYYYQHSDSILGKKKTEHSIDMYKAMNERYDYLEKIYPNWVINKVCVIQMITKLYMHENPELDKYFEEVGAFKLAKKRFSLKMLFIRLGFREKIKIILFCISPKLYKRIIKFYLKIKNKIKGKKKSI